MARLGHLLKNNISLSQVLLLTFTSKAAIEMKERADSKLKSQAIGLKSGTFHAIVLNSIKQYASQYTLLDDSGAILILDQILRKNNTKGYGAKYLHEKSVLHVSKGSKGSFAQYLTEFAKDNLDYVIEYDNAFLEFIQYKKNEKLLEFNDVLIYATENTSQLHLDTFREIIVDEFQDTSYLQEKLLDALSPDSLYCVGDYDQSIYGFNGADITNIANFNKKHLDAKIFNLSKNYRSSPQILQLAEKVVSINERMFPKGFEAMCSNGAVPTLLEYHESEQQYSSVTALIKSRLSATQSNSIAVLFRNNASADDLVPFLENSGIEYNRTEKSDFLKKKGIVIALSLAVYISNQTKKQALTQAFQYATKHNLINPLVEITSITDSKGFINIYKSSHPLLIELSKLVKKCKNKSAVMTIELILNSEIYKKLILPSLKDASQFKDIQDGASPLITMAKPYPRVIDFIIKLKNLKNIPKDEKPKRVTLMSVHASKGLEFDEVYIIDLMQKRFPNTTMMTSLEEERRLFYVGVTRAKEHLTLLYAKKHKSRSYVPSQFLIEGNLVDSDLSSKEYQILMPLSISKVNS